MPKGAVSNCFNNGINGSKKHFISDFNYYLGSAKQAWDYETTSESLINHIKKTNDYGNDIGRALEELEPLNTTCNGSFRQGSVLRMMNQFKG
jgi:hypothetical protein